MGQDIPAETLPGGVNIISKKSLIVSFKGNILKLLNVKDPLVNCITIVCGFPTSKSFIETTNYLKYYFGWFRDECLSFKFLSLNYLVLIHIIFMFLFGFFEIFLFQDRHFSKFEYLLASFILLFLFIIRHYYKIKMIIEVNNEPNPILLACPQGIPIYDKVQVFSKNLIEPK